VNADRLIFGDDGEDASDQAWRWLTAHEWPEWKVDVLTADADPSGIEWGKPVSLEPWSPPWTRRAEDVAGAQVRFLTAATDPRAMLADHQADLVVVGIKSRRGLGGVVTGSTTEWLLHHPPSPVAIIRRSERVVRVLVCADGSVHSERAMNAFADLPWAPDCEATVLAVDDGRVDPGTAESTATALDGRVASVAVVTKSGKPTEVILTTIAETTPDLVVMGTRGLTGWRRLRLGSTASSVVRSSDADHLVACVDSSDDRA
jgi:nucleotide-binding universal stress UspA family protein